MALARIAYTVWHMAVEAAVETFAVKQQHTPKLQTETANSFLCSEKFTLAEEEVMTKLERDRLAV